MKYLDKIIQEKNRYIKVLKERKQAFSTEIDFKNVSFIDALSKGGLHVIAEVKKASPSKGIICDMFDPVAIATNYVHHHASALSVLTDTPFFQGSNDYLTLIKRHVEVPILRKDFILDPIQVYESKTIGADAILLILAVLSVSQAQELLDCAAELKLDVLVELHDESEIDKLYQLKGVNIIGINNRNLNSFKVDLKQSLQMKQLLKNFENCLFVAESGYQRPEELQIVKQHKFDAVLIGEGLVINKELVNFFYDEN